MSENPEQEPDHQQNEPRQEGRRGGRGQRARRQGKHHSQPRLEASQNYDYDLETNYHEKVGSFEDMGLSESLLHGIYSYGFQTPSEIQQLAIKPIIEMHPVIGQAQSGTGKTGAFGIGILQRINIQEKTTQAIILSPTRELTLATYDFINSIGNKMKGLSVARFIGGESVSEDQEIAKTLPHIIVASPGRALSLINDGFLRLEHLRICCLDEADELLKQGFQEQIRDIFQYIPEGTQILLFSATFPPAIYEITQNFMPPDQTIKILVKAEKLTLEGIKQYYINVGDTRNKIPTLFEIYEKLTITKAVIFANSVDTVNFLKEQLEKKGHQTSAIHGQLSMDERVRIMNQFKKGATKVLIATDLIARGIDIQQITLVINFELPEKSTETYLHRVGRAGRYGRTGIAINIIDRKEERMLQEIMRTYSAQIDILPVNISEILNQTNAENISFGQTQQFQSIICFCQRSRYIYRICKDEIFRKNFVYDSF